MIFVPGLIVLTVGTLIIYSRNKAKFIGLTKIQKAGKILLYAGYMFLGMVVFTIINILIEKH